MKPDDVLLSAYLDGEVPPRFQPEVEAAIANDRETGARYDALRALRHRLREAEIPELDRRMSESWVSIRRRLAVYRGSSIFGRALRQIRVPVPVLAATGVVLLGLIGVLVWSLLPARRPSAPDYLAQGRDVDVTIRVDNANMEQVLQWLVDQNMLGEVNIQLPEQQFRIVGEPVLVRPGDFARSAAE